MAKFNVVRRMPYSARQLFTLASDVAAYPEFVPLCQQARVWNERSDGEHVNTFTSSLLIVYDKLNLKEEFVSEVLTNDELLTIRAVSETGPVRHLENRWLFTQLDGEAGCDVEFSINYEMSSRPLQFVLSTMFDYALRKMMTAFEERAARLYGARIT